MKRTIRQIKTNDMMWKQGFVFLSSIQERIEVKRGWNTNFDIDVGRKRQINIKSWNTYIQSKGHNQCCPFRLWLLLIYLFCIRKSHKVYSGLIFFFFCWYHCSIILMISAKWVTVWSTRSLWWSCSSMFFWLVSFTTRMVVNPASRPLFMSS